MTKDVILTISGLQFAQEMEVAPVEIVTAGNYYKKKEGEQKCQIHLKIG